MQAAETARAIARRDLSPVEVLEHTLARADEWQPITRAFSQLHPDEALEQAREREDAVARGEDLGPLHGVPVAVKDLFDVAGWRTTGCCRAYEENLARADAAHVARLRAAGAVIVGKTNQHELAAGGTNTVSACGATHNPWDPSRVTGGSSGGSGAAVAARVVSLALGSDTGGSIRIPASMCGVVGLKPTLGRLPMTGAMPLAASLDTGGPMATTVQDAALALAALADEPGLAFEAERSVEGLRFGVPGGFFAAGCHPDVTRALETASEVLSESGAVQAEVAIENLDLADQAWTQIAWGEFARDHGHLLDRRDELHPQTVELLEYGAAVDDADLSRARERARSVAAALEDALEVVEVVMTPTTPFPAFHPDAGSGADVWDETSWKLYRGEPGWLTRPVNLAGLPAVSLPGGFSRESLPVGIQLIGRMSSEPTLLALGRAFQAATDHHRREPALPGPGHDTGPVAP